MSVTTNEKAAKEAPSAGSVYVACKLPHGLKLTLVREMTEMENTLGGTRTFKINRRTEETYTLKGIALHHGERPAFMMANGYALTKLPAKFWSTWMEQNPDNQCVREGLIFAQGSLESIRSQTRELKGVTSGFEPIDAESKDRKGRPVDPRMRGIRSVPKKEQDPNIDDDEMEGELA